MKVKTSVRFSATLLEAIDREAARQNCSRSVLVEQLVIESLDHRTRQSPGGRLNAEARAREIEILNALSETESTESMYFVDDDLMAPTHLEEVNT